MFNDHEPYVSAAKMDSPDECLIHFLKLFSRIATIFNWELRAPYILLEITWLPTVPGTNSSWHQQLLEPTVTGTSSYWL